MTTTLANSVQITTRYLRAFLRQPGYIAGTLVQPIIWLLLFGQLFERATEIPGFTSGSYMAFLRPRPRPAQTRVGDRCERHPCVAPHVPVLHLPAGEPHATVDAGFRQVQSSQLGCRGGPPNA